MPLSGSFALSTWKRYRDKLIPLAKRLETDFQPFKVPEDFDEMPPACRAGEVFTDAWGCVWNCLVDGMEGIIKKHPLDDWAGFENYRIPDPIAEAERGPRDWAKLHKRLKNRDYFILAPGERFWERLHFIRGYENTMQDLASGDKRIYELRDRILEHNLKLIAELIKYEVDGVGFGDDWGDQDRLMVNPQMWREVFKDSYRQMFQTVRKAGKHVFFHTDGFLLPIIDDLIECGVTILNLQSRANGIENIGRFCRGKVCVAIDVDRQWVFPFGKPEDVKSHIKECVDKIGTEKGGVIIHYHIFSDVPLRNIEAFAEVMEEIR